MCKEIESAFENTTKIIFGKSLKGIRGYQKWLEREVRPGKKSHSALSKKEMYEPPLAFYRHVAGRAVKKEESPKLGQRKLKKEDAKKLTLDNAAKILNNVKYYSPEMNLGENIGNVACSLYGWAQYCFHTVSIVHSRLCGYTFWPRESEYLFGCDMAFSSRFCIKCYTSANLTRCFEVADSYSCSDSYYCHNCENLQHSMFCFNIKNKKYAIGNIEVGREKYMKIKQKLLQWLNEQLDKNKEVKQSIYSIGCKKVH